MLYKKTVAEPTLELLKRLLAMPELSQFALVGGTNLALRLGHRISVDIDLFSNETFDLEEIRNAIHEEFPDAIELSVRKQTMLLNIEGVKTDLIRHQYTILQPVEEIGGLRLMSMPDVVAMKLGAISGRGAKKDFWDIYALLAHYTLPEMLLHFSKKYPNSDPGQIVRSLVYFEDAEQQADPIDLLQISWETVKMTIQTAVKSYTSQVFL
jgi:hypothetical protein